MIPDATGLHRASRLPRTRPARRSPTPLAVIMMAALAGCSEDTATPPVVEYDFAPILSNVGANVIVATYEDLEAATANLDTKVDALVASPDEGTLADARTAWRDARAPWELSESFLFGPVSTQGLDPALDSWPVNTVDLDAVLAGSDDLTPGFVAGLEGTLKGFHTLEYLLFGTSGTRTAASLTARELEYLDAVAANLHTSATALAAAWSPSGGDYLGTLTTPGVAGSPYAGPRAAFQELLIGMITIADEVANGKINDPFTSQDPTLEESRFSANSIVDFQDNLRSLRNLYTGAYDGTDGAGVEDFVASRDATLAASFLVEIDDAIEAIGAIPPPFSTAIFDHPTLVTAAQDAVRAVQTTLEADIAPLLDPLR